jgi:DNA polymerase III delta prime subunit
VRNLRENARYAPARGIRKIYIIDEVHMLTEPAFNALLKTLEEPPPHVLFILPPPRRTKFRRRFSRAASVLIFTACL